MSENLAIFNDFIAVSVPDKAESITEEPSGHSIHVLTSNEFGCLAGIREVDQEFGHRLTLSQPSSFRQPMPYQALEQEWGLAVRAVLYDRREGYDNQE